MLSRLVDDSTTEICFLKNNWRGLKLSLLVLMMAAVAAVDGTHAKQDCSSTAPPTKNIMKDIIVD